MAKLYPISTAHNHDEIYAKKSEAGVTDHGALTGLGDNDHPQYLLAERYAVRAYRDATAFTLTTSGSLYAIPLNQEIYDTHNQHDNSTNPTRITCVKAGMYLIVGMITFVANTTGNRDALLRLNGTTYIGNQRLEAFATGSCTLNVSTFMPLAVGDYVELVGRQYSGGSLDLYYANSENNFMTMVRIGD